MPRTVSNIVIAALLTVTAMPGHAAITTFNAADPGAAAPTRLDWLAAAGVVTPQFLVDFETGLSDGQNVNGVAGLFPGGLVISDSSGAGTVAVEGSARGIGGSNPVGGFAIEHNERPYLVLDFTGRPADYVGFRDIDHTGTSIRVTHLGGAVSTFAIETTAVGGDSAEFTGIVRNDLAGIVRIEMDASGDGTWGIDDLEFGLTPVPLPAAAVLLGPAALLLVRRRRRGVRHLATG